MYKTTSETIYHGLRVITPTEPILTSNERAELISTAANESTIFWTWKIVKAVRKRAVERFEF